MDGQADGQAEIQTCRHIHCIWGRIVNTLQRWKLYLALSFLFTNANLPIVSAAFCTC